MFSVQLCNNQSYDFWDFLCYFCLSAAASADFLKQLRIETQFFDTNQGGFFESIRPKSQSFDWLEGSVILIFMSHKSHLSSQIHHGAF